MLYPSVVALIGSQVLLVPLKNQWNVTSAGNAIIVILKEAGSPSFVAIIEGCWSYVRLRGESEIHNSQTKHIIYNSFNH